VNYALVAVQTARCRALLRLHGIRAGLVTVEGRLPVLHGGGDVCLGRLALRSYAARIELGAAPGGRLDVGDRTFVNQGASLVATLSIVVGEDVRIGEFAGIFDSDHHPVEQGVPTRQVPVTIGHNAWIGRAAIVLPGVTVGEHAVVAAGSIVTHDVPPRTLVAGNPARPLRELAADARWRRP
jgi:acetyltransferase-like isoleucine patch superfamily enzyme